MKPADHKKRDNQARNKERRDKATQKAQRAAQKPVELLVEDLAHGGEGIARLDGRVVFIPGALPGDRVALSPPPINDKKNFWRSDSFELVEASVQRRHASCAHRPDCGGCPWHELERDAAASAKINNVYQSLLRIAKFDVQNQPGLLDAADAREQSWELTQDAAKQLSIARPRQDIGWRLRARLAVKHDDRDKGQSPSWAGFYSGASHRIIDIDHCQILHPKLDTMSSALLQLARDEAWPTGQLHISLGFAPDNQDKAQIAASFVIRPQGAKGQAKGRKKVLNKRQQDLKDPEITKILEQMMQTGLQGAELCVQNKLGQIRQLGQQGVLDLFGLIAPETSAAFSHDPLSFLQASQAGNAALSTSLAKVLSSLELAENNNKALELHAGAGNFSFALAKRGWHVDAVENAPRSAKHLRANIARLRQQDPAQQVAIVAADAEDVPVLQSQIGPHYNLLLLDPPRSGYKPLAALAELYKFNNIIYISCDPASLARDLKGLMPQGYQVKSLQIVDMMPGSWQVETLVHLQSEPI